MRVWYPCPYPPVTLRHDIRRCVEQLRRTPFSAAARRQWQDKGVVVDTAESLESILQRVEPIALQYKLTLSDFKVRWHQPMMELYAPVPESDQEYLCRLQGLLQDSTNTIDGSQPRNSNSS